MSLRVAPRAVNISYSAVNKVRTILNFYSFNSFLEWRLMSLGHKTFCGLTKPTPPPKLTSTIVESKQLKILIWSTKQTFHPEKLCGFTATWVIISLFKRVYCRRQLYHEILIDFLILKMKQRGYLHSITFVEDGAPPHVALSIRKLLIHHFINAMFIRHFFNRFFSWLTWYHLVRLSDCVLFLKHNYCRKRRSPATGIKESLCG